MHNAAGEQASQDVVAHYANAAGQTLRTADGKGLHDVKKPKEQKAAKQIESSWRQDQHGIEKAGKLVYDDLVAIFFIEIYLCVACGQNANTCQGREEREVKVYITPAQRVQWPDQKIDAQRQPRSNGS